MANNVEVYAAKLIAKTSSSKTTYEVGKILHDSYTLTLPSKTGTIALLSDIPKIVISNFVTVGSEQTISGAKTFTNTVYVNNSNSAGGINLANATYGIRWSTANYCITNMETGSITLSLEASVNSQNSATVQFHNCSKGAGNWKIFVSIMGGSWCNTVIASVTDLNTTSSPSFKIFLRRVLSGGQTSYTVSWLAIKVW